MSLEGALMSLVELFVALKMKMKMQNLRIKCKCFPHI